MGILTHGQDARVTGARSLLLAEDDAALGEIVGGELDLDAVAGQDADEVLAHFAGDDAEDLAVGAVELELEHGVGQRLGNGRFNFDRLLLGHAHAPGENGRGNQKGRWYALSAAGTRGTDLMEDWDQVPFAGEGQVRLRI